MAQVRLAFLLPRAQMTIAGVVQLDPWLSPFKEALRSRYSRAQKLIKTINDTEGGLERFSRGNEKFGFVVHESGDITYREWAPNALRAYLIGDFSKSHTIRFPTLLLLIRQFARRLEQRRSTNE